ncbi:acetate/propionate family kinase [Roseomonas sp. NAR14]|uniref:Acetate kinase n=1 Tax=Roseomonas acroporae TaxID=2937791 RepID=A0A9X2BSM9_9PROT|nr:acetate/propionate family kinase [Roseomonas acroporae]MCK8783297.1 acetate/propionate family kinase [Roseomonas acroporae]
MSKAILVLNAGSSSIKFELFRLVHGEPEPELSGQMEGIGAAPHLLARDSHRKVLADRRWPGPDVSEHVKALALIMDGIGPAIAEHEIVAIGHRVVHGGPDLAEPVVVDAAVTEKLRALAALAPLHQPHNLAGIDAATRRFPGVPQVACFDTAFHRHHPWEADTFALPPEFYARGIRRYGFHGLSYEYIAHSLAETDPDLAAGRVVVAHLGNGSSLCAMRGGRSLDSTMGFTALDGVPMGTRCGQIDPGVLLHLMQEEGMSAGAVSALLYGNSGLRGMSGVSQDVRALSASDRPEAAAALRYYAYRVRREIGALAAAMGGLDALVFTAGIGENARDLRGEICAGLEFLGIRIDAARNEANAPVISADGTPGDASVRVLVRPTDEEGMIARHVIATLGLQADASPGDPGNAKSQKAGTALG